MPAWLLTLVGLGPIVIPLVRRALFALGFGLVTYKAVDTILANILARATEAAGGVPEAIGALLTMGGFFQAVSIIGAAYGIKLGFMGLNAAGNIIKPRWNWND